MDGSFDAQLTLFRLHRHCAHGWASILNILLLTVNVGCHSSGWGCDRVWAETVWLLGSHCTVEHQVLVAVLSSLSSVCGVPCPQPLARDAEN